MSFEKDSVAPLTAAIVRPSLGALAQYFLRLGTLGFGGPIALVGAMERDFVSRRAWATHAELRDAIAFGQLAPGPLAAQVAMYLGWLCAGTPGATIAAIAFILPSFVMVAILARLYVQFGGMSWLAGAFYGIGAAVIAIIARSAYKLVRTSLGNDRLLWLLGVTSALVTAITESEKVWLFVACGAMRVGWGERARLGAERQSVIATFVLSIKIAAGGMTLGTMGLLAVVAPVVSLGTIFLYFASAGLFVFGSGLAIVPFLHGGVVQEMGWLTERQFLDAVAVALITPGPVVITVAFIGFLVAGFAGATAAAAGVFAPVYFITVILAPHFFRLKSRTSIREFVDGVTAAATGAIAGAAFVLGRRAIVDVPTALIAVVVLAVLLRTKRVPEPLLVAAAALIGITLQSFGIAG